MQKLLLIGLLIFSRHTMLQGMGAHARMAGIGRDVANRLLLQGAWDGNLIDIANAFVGGAEIHARDDEGNTALMIAAWHGRANVIDALLPKLRVEDIDISNNFENTALIHAVQRGHRPVVAALIHAGANINLQGYNHGTPLIVGAYHNQGPVVALLARLPGINLNLQDTINGSTALMVAVREGNLFIVQDLVDAGADLEIYDNEGYTALDRARVTDYDLDEVRDFIIDILQPGSRGE